MVFLAAFLAGCRSFAPSPNVEDSGAPAQCGFGTPPGSNADLVRWPYVQNVTPTSAVLAFGAQTGMWIGAVSVGRDGTYATASHSTLSEEVRYAVGKDDEPLTFRLHHAEITGLEPDTEYCYRVESMNEELASGLSFKTAPAQDDATVHFLAVGDFGAGTLAEYDVRDAMAPYKNTADFLITTGDNAYSYGKYEEWQSNVFEVYEDLLTRVPMFAVPGNHDYYTDDAQPFRANLFLPENAIKPDDLERYYSMDWGPIHFVGLDSETPLTQITDDIDDDDERDWLDDDLALADRPWTIAAYHKPMRDNMVGRAPDANVITYLVPTLEAYEVPLVLQGHDHHYERFFPMQGNKPLPSELGGTTYVISGGGGRDLYDLYVGEDPLQAVGAKTYNFLYGTADACTLTITAIDEKGFPFDSFTIDHC